MTTLTGRGGPSAFARLLSDAERRSRDGDRRRAHRLLALASDLSTPVRIPSVVLAWNSVGQVARPEPVLAAVAAPAAPERRGRRAGRVAAPRLESAGLPMPEFPAAGPELDRQAVRVPLPSLVLSTLPPAAPRGPVEEDRGMNGDPEARPVKSGPGLGDLVKNVAILAIVVVAALMYMPESMKEKLPAVSGLSIPGMGGGATLSAAEGALTRGEAGKALRILDEMEPAPSERAHVEILRGRALARTGDDAGAARAFVAAAQADSRGEVALEAARAASRLPGQEAAAADAYLLAFASGHADARGEWEAVAAAQEKAGERERAERVRAEMRRPAR